MESWFLLPVSFSIATAAGALVAHDEHSHPRICVAECEGCFKRAEHEGENVTFEVVKGLAIGNGQCNGEAPPCNASPCEYGGIVEIKNITGLPFWVDTDGNGTGTRTQVLSQTSIVVGYQDEILSCSGEQGAVQITIYSASTGGQPDRQVPMGVHRVPRLGPSMSWDDARDTRKHAQRRAAPS